MKKSPSSLQFVPDWFVTQGQVKIWHDDGDYWDDGKDKFFKWYNGYKKWKAQKAKIKEELLTIALQPSRWWDWCMSENKK